MPFCPFSDFSFRLFLVLQLLYPLLMFVAVWRTIKVRVSPNVLLIFRPLTSEETGGGARGVLARVRTSWRNEYSFFSWADKGQWETVETQDGQVQRDGDWFRIGFEPVFVDYTKRGTWFLLATLIQVRVGGGNGIEGVCTRVCACLCSQRIVGMIPRYTVAQRVLEIAHIAYNFCGFVDLS